MELLLIGNGKMNQLVAAMAAEQGKRVAAVVDSGDPWPPGWSPGLVAIDFSVAGAVAEHVEQCMSAGIPIVIGTTGWGADLHRVQEMVAGASVGAIYGANFSVGVQALYRLVREAAASLPPSYEAYVWEAHHRQKKDAPSGTGARLAELLREGGHAAGVASTRAGSNPGTHTVGFDSPDDTLTLTHTARSRRGFAAGALLAAEWILGRRGWYEFSAVYPEIMAAQVSRGA